MKNEEVREKIQNYFLEEDKVLDFEKKIWAPK